MKRSTELSHQVKGVPMQSQHHSFVFDSWLRSSAQLPQHRSLPRPIFNVSYGRVISRLVKEDNVLVLVDRQDPDLFLGFIAWCLTEEGPVVDYLYVKRDLRRAGLGRHLIQAALGDVDTVVSPCYRAWMLERVDHQVDPFNMFGRRLVEGAHLKSA